MAGRSQDLDSARLAAWLNDAGIADGPVRDVRALVGGTQNLILRFTAGDRNLVLRRPPPDRASSEKTIRREAIVLAALAETDLPHPRLRGLCEDAEILGGTFLVTDEVDGFNATSEMPERAGSDPAFRYGMGIALAEGLAALASVPVDRGAIATLGSTDGFVERQVDRWASQLAGYADLAGWPGPEALGPVTAIGDWLRANLPEDRHAGLMHGDYHIANVLFRRDTGGLAAILDWELAALGDPLLDLARLVTVWPNARNEGLLSLKVEPWDAFPPVEALIERYAAITGRSMAALPWFEALACYKFGIILEGTHARACAGHADPAVGARLHASAKGLVARAAATLDRA
ncbi:phosphotransferase family protein [Sphingomonas immobilis]|uniref:Phosphotransferase family protein n=1 Tax=Sphingomonas immobilis TaxID=3063997 RepID=A0ABT9A011_9SPHN|nr:phosphotransferase family protein [Sphingomonas sp. CA1-15]MDO7843166.1 phosphotransferase family protein [Sphingomonas sp. CA1-15]